MAKFDVIEELAARFEQPLPDCRERRVVVWHDAEGEFATTFAELAEGGFDDAIEQRLPRPVRFVEACDGHMFEVKRLIAREDTTSDMLVYRQQGRGGLEGDWLADVELYADQFSADYLSLLADQLGASNARDIRKALQAHKSFFAAKGRVAKFSKCMPAPACAADVELGLLAAMFGGSDPSAATMPFIVRACLTKLLHDGPEALSELAQKFEAADSLAAFVRQRTGFEGALFERDSLPPMCCSRPRHRWCRRLRCKSFPTILHLPMRRIASRSSANGRAMLRRLMICARFASWSRTRAACAMCLVLCLPTICCAWMYSRALTRPF